MVTTKRAQSQAKAYLEHIVELIQRLRAAQDAGDEAAMDAARAEIEPLKVLVRSGWHRPGEAMEPKEFQILLCSGGPAVRIVGDLDHGQPTTAELQYRDWDTPWVSAAVCPEEEGCLLEYARLRLFYYWE